MVYLLLFFSVRALDFVRIGKLVPRGTIQVTFVHRPFDHVLRLGLSSSTEAHVRKQCPNEIGMLVAEVVLPNG